MLCFDLPGLQKSEKNMKSATVRVRELRRSMVDVLGRQRALTDKTGTGLQYTSAFRPKQPETRLLKPQLHRRLAATFSPIVWR